jgi:hypothetical protein
MTALANVPVGFCQLRRTAVSIDWTLKFWSGAGGAPGKNRVRKLSR